MNEETFSPQRPRAARGDAGPRDPDACPRCRRTRILELDTLVMCRSCGLGVVGENVAVVREAWAALPWLTPPP